MTAPLTAPRVYLVEDICEALQISRSTLKRLRRAGTFPIPELPALDKHPRWSADAVENFLLSHAPKRSRLRLARSTQRV